MTSYYWVQTVLEQPQAQVLSRLVSQFQKSIQENERIFQFSWRGPNCLSHKIVRCSNSYSLWTLCYLSIKHHSRKVRFPHFKREQSTLFILLLSSWLHRKLLRCVHFPTKKKKKSPVKAGNMCKIHQQQNCIWNIWETQWKLCRIKYCNSLNLIWQTRTHFQRTNLF